MQQNHPQYNNSNNSNKKLLFGAVDDSFDFDDDDLNMMGVDDHEMSGTNSNNISSRSEEARQISSFLNTSAGGGLSQVRDNRSQSGTNDMAYDDDNLDLSYGDDYLGEDLMMQTMRPSRNNKVMEQHDDEDEDETLLQTNSYSEDKVEQFIKGEDFAGLSKEIEKLLESDNATPRLGNQTTTPLDNIGEEYASLSNNSSLLSQQQEPTNNNGMNTYNTKPSSSFITDEEAEDRLKSLLLKLDKSKISETNRTESPKQQSLSSQYFPPQQENVITTRMLPDPIQSSNTHLSSPTSSPATRERTPSKKIEEIIEKYEYLDSVSHTNDTKPVHSSNEDYLFDNSSANYNTLQGGDISSEKNEPKRPELTVSAPSTPSLSSIINTNMNQHLEPSFPEKEVELSNNSTIYEENNINNIIEMKLEPISQLLRSSGYAGFLGETDIVKRIKETFQMMSEDMERKTKTIELQSKNQQEFTKTMLKLKQQVEKANETCNQYKVQLEKKENEMKAFKDNNQVSSNKNEKEISQLKKTVEGMNSKVSQYESSIIVKDEEINDLKKKLYQIVSKEETKRINAMNIFCQANKRKPATKTDLKEIDLIAMYDEQRTQLKREVAFLKTEIQRLNENEVQNQNGSEVVQKNEEQIKKLIAQTRIERERYTKLEAEFNSIQQKLSAVANQNQRVITNLEEENTRLLNELKGRPQAQDFENLRQRSELIKKELMLKDKELTELKKSTDKSAVLSIPGGKWANAKEDATKKKKTTDNSLQTSFEKEDQKELSLYKDIIQEVCKILNISDVAGLVASLQKMVSIVKAVPKMEKFICEICDICKKGTVDLGHEIDLKPKVVAPLLGYWIEKLRENQEMEKEITQLLNNRQGKQPIDYSDPDYKELKKQILTSIEELVRHESNQQTQ